jgi:hypothetical protein
MNSALASSLLRRRTGFRLHHMLEVAVLLAVLAATIAITPVGKTLIQDLVDQRLADRQLNRLATDVVVQTLLCRRYEKDMLLHIDDPAVRDQYFARWSASAAELERAVRQFGAVAVTAEDRGQATRWEAEITDYRQAVIHALAAAERGAITTHDEANALIEPAKDEIRSVTDTAMALIDHKDAAADAAGEATSATLSGNARLVVLLGLAGLVVRLTLDRR